MNDDTQQYPVIPLHPEYVNYAREKFTEKVQNVVNANNDILQNLKLHYSIVERHFGYTAVQEGQGYTLVQVVGPGSNNSKVILFSRKVPLKAWCYDFRLKRARKSANRILRSLNAKEASRA